MENNPLCPVSIFTKKLGGKWKLEIIYNLTNRKLRFGQLVAMVNGISRKVLTDHLKQMESDNLIYRKSFNETPPIAIDLIPIFKELDRWVKNNY
jgi:DNA-binding HxlR family transcriptional regulator